uniref:Uncharacterized protein n=1 Tax=Pipistrellus kuhlii TaxID=59472 RepID=A0A7J7W3J8_PIPKU|nr:hypothetical protein mPipKuh1_008145 [Pipistrellus kuhlii]
MSVRPNSQVHLAHISMLVSSQYKHLEHFNNLLNFIPTLFIPSNSFSTPELDISSQGIILRFQFVGSKPSMASSNQGSGNYSSQAKSTPSPVFVNKVFLEHRCALLLMCCLRLLSHCHSKVE